MITSAELIVKALALAKEIDVHPKDIQICLIKGKWGTCLSGGVITLNRELLGQPSDIQIGVILHELLHLTYPNHGKMFKLMLNLYKEKYFK